MDSVIPQEVKWLWYPYIPLGKIAVMMGDSGDGKSTLILNIAAAVLEIQLPRYAFREHKA